MYSCSADATGGDGTVAAAAAVTAAGTLIDHNQPRNFSFIQFFASLGQASLSFFAMASTKNSFA